MSLALGPEGTEEHAALEASTLRQLLLYFLRLGAFGFGGPIALAGDMQRDLVERRRWISKQDYLEGLALSQLSPGPLAAQLAMYIGWVRFRALGALLVGLAFVLPSFAMVVVLAHVYIRYGGLPWMAGAFYGIGAAVIGIIVRSAVKLSRMTLGADRVLWALAGVSALVTAITEKELVWLFLGSGVVATLVKTRSGGAALGLLLPLLVAGIRGAAPSSVLGQLAWVFTKSGLFVFGSGLAIVPFLYDSVVNGRRAITDVPTLAIAAATLAILLSRKVPEPMLIVGAGVVGFAIRWLLHAASRATPKGKPAGPAAPFPFEQRSLPPRKGP